MLRKQMSFIDQYGTTCTVYWDKESDYYTITGFSEMIQETAAEIQKIINMVIDQKEENKKVIFTENAEFKKMLLRRAAVLIVEEKYYEARELICMLEESETEYQKETERFVVAESNQGLIAYDEKDYDKVIEANDYIAPAIIRKFKTWEEAMQYIKVSTLYAKGGVLFHGSD